MSFDIRPARLSELPIIEQIYSNAREAMRQSGNPHQWGDRHPEPSLLIENIHDGHLYVCTEEDQIAAVFYFRQGIDPTYRQIFHGQWLNDRPYAVIHHIAVAQRRRGIASRCFDYALSICPELRIDTHQDNLPMQRTLAKNGFHRCGIIHLPDGSERIAYQKTNGTL